MTTRPDSPHRCTVVLQLVPRAGSLAKAAAELHDSLIWTGGETEHFPAAFYAKVSEGFFY